MAASNETTARNTKRSFLGSLKQYIPEFGDGTKPLTNIEKTWKDWRNNFEDCLRLEEVESEKWLQILKILGGQQLREKIDTLCNSDDNFEQCKTKLNEYFHEKRSINAIRHEFFNSKQQEGESTRSYVERLRNIGKDCEFENFKLDDATIFNLCQYTPNEKLRNEILVKELTLEQAVRFGSSTEMAMKESARMKGKHETSPKEPYIKAMKRSGPYSKRTKLKEKLQKKDNSNKCGRCGRYEPHDCRAKRSRCHKCDRMGHFANMCRSKTVHQVEETESSEEHLSCSSETDEF